MPAHVHIRRPAALAPVYTVDEIRRIEQSAREAAPAPNLMERAGLAAAEVARELLSDRGRDVLVLAGPGNNGGDAFEAATHLRQWFHRVTVLFAGTEDKLAADARAALAKWRAAGGEWIDDLPRDARFDLVIDGLFGIGLARPVAGRHAELIEAVNELRTPVLALDVPSGLNADTGTIMGCAIHATRTLTFIARKPGLLTLDGPDCCGELLLATLGIDVEPLQAAKIRLTDRTVLARLPLRRRRNLHKGDAGSVAIVGGADGMIGAALLAGRAALKCGAGKVHLGLLAAAPPTVDGMQPELMFRAPEALLGDNAQEKIDVLAPGPGMGRAAKALALLARALAADCAMVLDADGLTLAASTPALRAALASRKAPTILTPHPGEAARLLACDTATIQRDRLAAARRLAAEFSCLVVLKGNGSICAAPDGRAWINGSGNPGMAAAGMGDTLTGMIASFLAQGAAPEAALVASVWLHGAAGDSLAAANGPLGITAGEIPDAARRLLADAA